jgi:hypothetical protein
VRDVEERRVATEQAVPVGILSSDGRDQWAKVGSHLDLFDPHITGEI